QVCHASWWPGPSMWEKSGLNVGYWSPDCEAWYAKRLQAIREKKGGLKTPPQWKN
ncbi:hypothetical protein BD779DRAFT_1383671, partial [Infundibulicybe gibba]